MSDQQLPGIGCSTVTDWAHGSERNTALKPPFAYYGGKTNLGQKIAALLPEHRHYVEPFAGSLAVLLAKAPSKLETVNDIDGDLMTFWRVLRDRGDELAARAALTPHSRAEHEAAYDLDTDDELERARRVWVILSQGRTGTMRRTGWRYFVDPNGTSSPMPQYVDAYVHRMPPAAARLRQVSLESRPALDVIRDYGQHETACIYADPPYVGSTRARNYRHEMSSEAEHRALAEALRAARAAVVLSGYHSPLYDELYADWNVIELAGFTGQSMVQGGYRTEVVWMNRSLPAADLDLFTLDFDESRSGS